MHPAFAAAADVARLRPRAAALRERPPATTARAPTPRPHDGAWPTATRPSPTWPTLADRERVLLAGVAAHMGTTAVYVPFLDHDVHDIAALHEVGRYLVG